MSALPPEVIQLILGYIFYKSEQTNNPDYESLRACALVSKSWCPLSRGLIYRRITANASSAFLRSAHEPSLLAHVKSFAISLTKAPTMNTIFELLPNVYELIIDAQLFAFSQLDLVDISSCMALTKTRVRALHLSGRSTQSPILFQLLSLLPTIEFLTLGVEIRDVPPQWTMPCSIYELKCYRNSSSPVLGTLLGPSLRVFEIRDPPSHETASQLSPYCSDIQSLRLMRFNNQCTTMISQCINLVELILFNIPTLVTFPHLPPSLEHLAIIIQTYTTSLNLEPVLNAVGLLPRLSLLTYVGDRLLELEDLCRRKKILFSSTPQKFWINDDPIKATRFPRRRSVSNFYLMN